MICGVNKKDKEAAPGTLCYDQGFSRNLYIPYFPKALRRVLPENPLNTDTSTLTLRHSHLHTHTLEERKHPSAKYASVKVCKCKYASMIDMQA